MDQHTNDIGKTRLEHFNSFPEPYRSQAIANTTAHGGEYSLNSNREFDGPFNALLASFVWDTSPEGNDYWWEFTRKFLKK